MDQISHPDDRGIIVGRTKSFSPALWGKCKALRFELAKGPHLTRLRSSGETEYGLLRHGHVLTRRRWMRTTLMSVAAIVGGGLEPRSSTAAAQTAETAAAALDVLRNSISVDVHTHGGTTGITSTAPPNDDLAKSLRVHVTPELIRVVDQHVSDETSSSDFLK